ncbi:hypothetical protein [Kitasatospora aureofaciens]|uniref:hypothetical protein n=1 Tax=Kitasatospora aureofaciens TaxID=1894 RepID=UPI00340DD7A2
MTTTQDTSRFNWPFAVQPARIAWHIAMLIVRPAAAGMAGWSLYVVARQYGVPWFLALFAVAVFDGVGLGCLYQATEAVKAGRSAAIAILATLGMAGVSVTLNVQHAHLIHGGHPAEIMFSTPAVGLLILSALSWSAIRAEARAARGETPMRLPAYGLWGWLLAPQQAAESLQKRAVTHVTSGASVPHPPASARTVEDDIAAEFAEIGPAAAIQRVAALNTGATDTEVAEILANYRVTVTPAQVALLLERAAVPRVTLDRVPRPPIAPAPALNAQMRSECTANAPQVKGMTKADAIITMAEHLGGLDTPAEAIAIALAKQDVAADTAYIRGRISLTKRKAAQAAQEAAAQTEQQRAEYERRNGNGGYA